jgi:hypothetical protein
VLAAFTTHDGLRNRPYLALSRAVAAVASCLLAACLDGSVGASKADDGDSGDGSLTCSPGEDVCPNELVCIAGACTPPGGALCSPDALPFQDGCASDELCFEDPSTSNEEEFVFRCFALPPCPAEEPCPITELGAVCNDGLVAGKDRVCLLGMCTDSESHCPNEWKCIADAPGNLGQCSDGTFGMPCALDADCNSGNCLFAFPIGFCG